MQTTTHKIDKQQGFTVQHREQYSVSCNNLHWNITWKKKPESLCYTSETNTTLYINYMSIKKIIWSNLRQKKKNLNKLH